MIQKVVFVRLTVTQGLYFILENVEINMESTLHRFRC